jgi:hypothetical protein
VAHLPSKTIDHGGGPVDQSRAALFIHSAHHLSDTSRRDNSSATTGDHDRIPRSGLGGHDLLGELIREYAQVASYGREPICDTLLV